MLALKRHSSRRLHSSKLFSRIKLSAAVIAAGLGLLGAASAHAELLQYQFSSPEGEQRVLPASATHANPIGQMTFVLSAGIDRRVRMSILSSAGQVISTATSGLLGASDRIVVDGREYYGAFLSLSAPGEGTYTLKAETLSAEDVPVRTDTHSLIIDTTPPTASPITATNSAYGQVTTGNVWKLGLGGSPTTYFQVANVTDASPIKETHVRLYRGNGTLHFTRLANYDAPSRRIDVINNKGVFFPASNLDEEFKLQFTATDMAGNTWESPKQSVRFDNVVNAPTAPFGVYVPGSSNVLGPGLSGFVPYQPGMEVQTNPIRLAYRVPRSNWHEYNESGISLVNSLGERNVVGTDSQYVYIIWSAPYGNLDQNYTRWSNFGQWGGASIAYNLKLAASAPKTPNLLGVDYHYSDIGWSSFYRYAVDNSLLPVSFDKIRVHAEARTYDQVATHRGTCTIPAGQSSCIINSGFTMQRGTTGYLHDNAVVRNVAQTLISNPRWAEVNWNDLHYPILSHQFNDTTKELTLYVTQPGRGSYFDRLRLHSAWLEDGQGNVLSVQGGMVEENGQNYTFRWDLKSLPEKHYDLVAVAREMHGPVSRRPLFPFAADKTPPEITIVNTGDEVVASLDQFRVEVVDQLDQSPRVVDIRLEGGPADDRVQLSWRSESPGVFRLEYPVMFPSLVAGEEYILTVTAQDDFNNRASTEHTFLYQPMIVGIKGDLGDGVKVPAVEHAFVHADGLQVVSTESLVLSDGSVVEGVYDVFATLRSDSEMALIINGVRVEPGATMTVLPSHNFGAHQGKINIPLSAADYQVEGRASLLLSTTAPNAPVVLANIETWVPNLGLTADAWSVYPALEEVSIGVENPAGHCSQLTSDPAVATTSGHPITEPVCLIEWQTYPRELYGTEKDGDPILMGYTATPGESMVRAHVSLVTADGYKIRLETLEQSLDVKLPEGSIKTRLTPELGPVERLLQELSFEIRQVEGPKCSVITLVEDQAIDAAGRGSPSCLLTWDSLPDGLEQDPFRVTTPRLSGSIEYTEGDTATIAWTIDAFTPAGTKVSMGRYTQTLDVIDPPLPTIRIESRNHLEGDLYSLSEQGGYLGDMTVEGRPANIRVLESHNGVLVSDEEAIGMFSNISRITQRLNMDAAPLWSYNDLHLEAFYSLLPEMTTHHQVRVLSVPDRALRPYLELDEAIVLNTDTLTVVAGIQSPFSPGRPYDLGTMGEWEIRLLNYMSLSRQEPLTEYKPLGADGTVTFGVDPRQIDATGFRLVAEARLVSPEPLYQRVELSPRPVYVTVLRGEPIGAEVTGRRFSGQAPLTFMGMLQLDNRLDQGAMGEVIWELRDRGQTDWQRIEDTGFVKGRIMKTFQAGQYDLRARIINTHSGAEFVTGVVDIHAFDVPAVSLEGPWNVFIGDTGTYRIEATLHGEEVPADQLEVLWSLDDGATWLPGEARMEISRDTLQRVTLRARTRLIDSDADVSEAWVERRGRISFRPVLPPRAGIVGPRIIEMGTEHEWRSVLRAPFRHMEVGLEGYFVLPDGTRVDGETLRYSPSEADLQNGYVNIGYVSWIDGFPETHNEISQRIRVWIYEWPRWDFYSRLTAVEAPANLSIRVRSPGSRARYIEGLSYEWHLPEGAVVEQARSGDSRVLSFAQAGTYPITVEIRDDRGHHSRITRTIVLDEQTPWEADYRLNYSNAAMREPLTVGFRPMVSGGHPRDRVTTFRYLLNGEVVASDIRYGSVQVPVGEHEIAMQFDTEFGHTVEKRERLSVAPNQPPVCSLDVRTLDSSWRFYAECRDRDGTVVGHRWIINGDPVGVSGSRISITRRDEQKPSVTLIGIDDAGGESAPVHW